jgi:oligoendopeptidase F
MEHKKDIPLRSELRLEDTWNLVPIYADDAAWEADFVEVDGKAPKAADYQGRLGESAQVLLDAIKFQEEVYFKVGLLYVYAHLNFDTDTTNAHYQAMFSRIESLYAKTSAAFSFYPFGTDGNR